VEELIGDEGKHAVGIEGPLRTELDAEVLRATGIDAGLRADVDLARNRMSMPWTRISFETR